MTRSGSHGIGQLLGVLRANDSEGRTDGQLLERFLIHQDDAAFTALVGRQGPMVLGVCRRILGSDADSEDAFQATFLVLVRKAPSLMARSVLGDWLHGVARYTALKAKAAAGHRLAKEQVMARPDATVEQDRNDWLPLLDDELARLPEKYRLPIVLCDLEGKTRHEAAKQLGWPEGTVAGRLARARKMLAKAFARHGVVFSVGALTVAMSQNAATASVPGSLLFATVKAARMSAAGKAATGVVSAKVAALTEGVLKAMFLTKLKIATVVLLVVVILGVATGAYTFAVAGEEQPDTFVTLPQDDKQKDKNPKKDEGHEDIQAMTLPAGALARLGWDALRLGHFSGALTPDGKKVVTLSTGAVVHIFDAATGRLLERRLLGDRRDLCPETWNFSLSADGSVAVVEEQTSSGRLTAWTVATGRQLLCLGRVSSHALSPDGRSLAAVEFVADQGKEILRVYDLESGKPRNIAFSGNLSHLRFSPDGRRLLGNVVGGQADEIVCYDVAGAKRLWAVSPGAAEVGVTPDNRFVFLVKPRAKEPFRAVDLETGEPAKVLKLPTCEAAGEPALAGNRLLLVPLRTGEVAVWDYRAGKELRRLRATPRDFLSVRVFAAADGKTALTDGDALRCWDLATGEQIFGPSGVPAHFGVVQALAFVPGGELLSASAGGELRRWDIASGRLVGELGRAAGSEVWITRAGVRMKKAEWSHDLIVVDTAGKRVGKVTLPHDATPLTSDLFWQYALLSDGRTAVTYVPRKGKVPVVAVTDYVAGKVLAQLDVDLPVEAGAHFQGFAPCGRWLVANGQMFAVSTGKPVWAPSAGQGWDMWKQSTVTFSPDSRLLWGRVSVSSSAKQEDFDRGEHDVWEMSSGARLARLQAKQVSRVAFSPDNRTLA
jgi:RNA polymerase sigma factor (sigma-70 family)